MLKLPIIINLRYPLHRLARTSSPHVAFFTLLSHSWTRICTSLHSIPLHVIPFAYRNALLCFCHRETTLLTPNLSLSAPKIALCFYSRTASPEFPILDVSTTIHNCSGWSSGIFKTYEITGRSSIKTAPNKFNSLQKLGFRV